MHQNLTAVVVLMPLLVPATTSVEGSPTHRSPASAVLVLSRHRCAHFKDGVVSLNVYGGARSNRRIVA